MTSIHYHPYQPCVSNRVCAYTGVNEKDLVSAGKNFVCCFGCRETFYADLDAQLAHWPAHSQVCCSIENDDWRINHRFVSLDTCLNIMEECVTKEGGLKGRLFLHAMREFKRIYESSSLEELLKTNDTRAKWFRLSRKYICKNKLVCAIPGFCNFVLSEDFCLSHTNKQAKLSGLPPVRQENVERWELRAKAFLALDALFILGSFCEPPETSDGNGTKSLKTGSSFAAAAMRHIMYLWQCPYAKATLSFSTRRPTPDGRYASPHLLFWGFFMDVFEEDRFPEWTHKGELVPGMTLASLLELIMEDESFYSSMNEYSRRMSSDLELLQEEIEREGNEDLRLTPTEGLRLLGIHRKWEAKRLLTPCFFDKFLADIVMGHYNTRFMLGIYDLLMEKQDPQVKQDSQASEVVKKSRRAMMNQVRPSLVAFLDCVRKEHTDLWEEDQFLPDDVIPIILAFALPDYCGKPRTKARPPSRINQRKPSVSEPVDKHTLTLSTLASKSQEVQKEMIRETLYPLVYEIKPALAGKITGMLLEKDNVLLLDLLDDKQSLLVGVKEAVNILDCEEKEWIKGKLYPLILLYEHPILAGELTRDLLKLHNDQLHFLVGNRIALLFQIDAMKREDILRALYHNILQHHGPNNAALIIQLFRKNQYSFPMLLKLLQSPEALQAMIDRAIAVFDAQQAMARQSHDIWNNQYF